MATFRFEISNKPTRNKTYPIFIVVSVKGKRKRLKTAIAVNRKSDFNSRARHNNWIRSSEPHYSSWNEALSNEIELVRRKYNIQKVAGQVTSESIVAEMRSAEKSSTEKSIMFLDYAKQRTRDILNTGHISTWKTYNGFCNKLEGYLNSINKKDISINNITTVFISNFHNYLAQISNERQPEKVLHQNTIHLSLRIFKTLIKRIIEVDKALQPQDNPFTRYKVTEVKTSRNKLDISEIENISNLDLPKNSLIWHCRNYFLFSFYCAGIRVSDLIQLRWNNITSDGKLCYTMGKNHKERTLTLISQADNILSHYRTDNSDTTKYIFPILDNSASFAKYITQEEKDTMSLELKKKLFNQLGSSAALINKNIQLIASKANINKKISFHVARHSFAKAAKQEGIDNFVLKDMLNHSSLATTEIYMKDFDSASADKAMNQIFKKDESPKDEIYDLLNKMNEDEIYELLNDLKSKKK